MEATLKQIIQRVGNSYGQSYLESICQELHQFIKADYTFVARLDMATYSSTTLALVAKGELVDNFSYSLTDTPCANVLDDSLCHYPTNVCQLFPHDQLLIDMQIEGYLGAPLKNSQGQVFGLLVALYEQEINDAELTSTLFEIFAGRAAAEIERIEYEASLEQKVAERTQALESAVQQLNNTQAQLVEREKLAALGDLVAGVAHEVNTPLGVSITANSFLLEQSQQLNDKLTNKTLSQEWLRSYIDSTIETNSLVESNLRRAKTLIENFKLTAADQFNLERENTPLRSYIEKLLTTLTPMLKKQNIVVTVRGCDEPFLTYPGAIGQIITNLVTNSCKHGFIRGEISYSPEIIIDISESQNKGRLLRVIDNGKGMSDEVSKNIFTPFFTTARKDGGTGLGMSIIYNLITQKLEGSIQLGEHNIGQGSEFIIELPPLSL